jgi:hypothetical protein
MSAYSTLETIYRDRDCLVVALADMGYTTVEVHEDAQNLQGYHGDMREQKANVIVRRQYIGAASNDLGFVKKEDGTYAAVVSDFDSRKHNTKWYDSLKRSYTDKVTTKAAKKMGLKLHSRTVVNGKLVIKYLKQGA